MNSHQLSEFEEESLVGCWELWASPGWVSKNAGPLQYWVLSWAALECNCSKPLLPSSPDFPAQPFRSVNCGTSRSRWGCRHSTENYFLAKISHPKLIQHIPRSHEGLGNFTRTNSTYYLPYPISNISYIQFPCPLFKIRCQFTNVQRHVEFQTWYISLMTLYTGWFL